MTENSIFTSIPALFQAVVVAAVMTGWMQSSALGGILFAYFSLKQKKAGFYSLLIIASTITGCIAFWHIYNYAFDRDWMAYKDSLVAGLLPIMLFPVFLGALVIASLLSAFVDPKNKPELGPNAKYWLLVPLLFCAGHLSITLWMTLSFAFKRILE